VAFSDLPIESALAGLDASTAATIQTALRAQAFSGRIEGISPATCPSLLQLAAAFSVHPISGFSVGAIAVGSSGSIYLGANLEFQGMPLHATLHAEQSAVLNAWMHNETEITALYVSETPCGHCRQFLRELSNIERLTIHVHSQTYTLDALLPHAFGDAPAPNFGLLDSRPSALEAVKPQPNTSKQRAINAAQRSYAPYSRSPEGCVLECLDGQIFSGRTAESAAFNPSVPAVLVALNQRNLSASRQVAITVATEAKLATAVNNPLPFTTTLIHSISNAEIQVVQMDAQ
jgi:cytidine deaminase